jgi:glycosyltransferase 2 family protein
MGMRRQAATLLVTGERHSEDGVRLVLGLFLVAITAWSASYPRPGAVQVNVFDAVYQLPALVRPPLLGLMQLGSLTAVPLLALMALLGRRARLSSALLLSGVAAWAASQGLAHLLGRQPPSVVLGVVLRGGASAGFSYPASHVAVAAAMATVAGVHLSGPTRRLCWLTVGLVALARIYVGANFPLDVIGGAALGWSLGALYHLIAGASRGIPPPDALLDALEEVDPMVSTVEQLADAPPGTEAFQAGPTNPLYVKVVGGDQPDAGWLTHAWRLLAFRQFEEEGVGGSPAHRVEHEAYVSLTAERAGIATTPIRAVRHLGSRASIIASEWTAGTRLDQADGSTIDNCLLEQLWRLVATLHDHGVAHRSLIGRNIILRASDGPCLVNFAAGQTSASPPQFQSDNAQLLVTIAAQVGASRATESAIRVLGTAAIAELDDHLQPLALPSTFRALLRSQPDLLSDLRVQVGHHTGASLHAVERPVNVAARNLIPLVGALFAVNLLLPRVDQVGSTISALEHARWTWLPATLASAGGTFAMAALALHGAANLPLVYGRTLAVQVAAGFTNRLAPAGLGGMATNVRYLELTGATRSTAVTTVAMTSAAGLFVHLCGGIAIALLLTGGISPSQVTPRLPEHWPLLLAVLAVMIAGGVLLWKRWLAHRILPGLRTLRISLTGMLARPGGIARLLIGQAGITSSHLLALLASLQAFGGGVSVARVTAAYLAGTAVAALVPTPGGVGALEAALTAAMVEVGAPIGPAVASILLYRFATYWLPILPGAVTFRILRRRQVL